MAKKSLNNGQNLGTFRNNLKEMFDDMYAGQKSRILSTPTDRPLLVVATGQSNMLGPYQTSGMFQNDDVWDWQGPNSVKSPDPFAFYQLNPNRAAPDSSNWGTVYDPLVGHRGGGFGHIGFLFCDYVQKLTGRTVYMVTVARNDTAIADWADGEKMEAELDTQVSAAISALTAQGVTTADFVIWMQGEADWAAGRDPRDYADDLSTFKSLVETKWATEDFTQWLVCGLADPYEDLAPWGGLDKFCASQSQYVQFVNATGCDATFDVTWHYLGTGLRELAKRCALTAFGHVAPNHIARQASALIWNAFKHTSVMVNENSPRVAFQWDTSIELSDTSSKLVEWMNNGTSKAHINYDGELKTKNMWENFLGTFLFSLPLNAGAGYLSLLSDSPSNISHRFSTLAATTQSKFLGLINGGTEILSVDHTGSVTTKALEKTSSSSDSPDTRTNHTSTGKLVKSKVKEAFGAATTTGNETVNLIGLNLESGTPRWGTLYVSGRRTDSVSSSDMIAWVIPYTAHWTGGVIHHKETVLGDNTPGIGIAFIGFLAILVNVTGKSGQNWSFEARVEYQIDGE